MERRETIRFAGSDPVGAAACERWFARVGLVNVAVALALPLARRWVDAQQARILREGVPLTATEVGDARRVGVMNPGLVRLLRVSSIPVPGEGLLRFANGLARMVSANTAGITFGHGIFIRDDFWGDRSLVVHELVHVGQYERLGGTKPFLRRYLHECLAIGYPRGPLEQEAIDHTALICG
jgi:hypothetical protein